MNHKGFFNALVLVLVLLTGAFGYVVFLQQEEASPTIISTPSSSAPSLSADKKSIVVDDTILLAIDNNIIFSWFQTESQLCDGENRTSTPDRKMFCENKVSFKSQTRFTSIVVAPDTMSIGFTIESDTLSPDTVAGIFLRPTNKVQILTNYYLGNEFISFSPDGASFVFRSYCFEGNCGFTIKNSSTLADTIGFGDTPDHSDYQFVRWISDKEIEYKDGTEVKRLSL